MYLHIGGNYMIKKKYTVGIFDIENTTVSSFTRDMLSLSEKNNEVINVTSELPRSFILYKEKDKKTVFITQLSSSTLLKRNKTDGGERK